MKFKMRSKLFLVAFFFVCFSSAFIIGKVLTRPRIVIASITNVMVAVVENEDPLHLEVVPNGYPVVGESWTIFVYNYSDSSNKPALIICPNSSVLISVNFGDYSQTYNLSMNDAGQTSFNYLTEYRDVAFQAFRGESRSRKIVISDHYVSSESVHLLSGASTFVSLAVSITFAVEQRRIRKILKLAIISLICLFLFVTFSSVYSLFFQGTIWGYPEKVFSNFITLTTLKYAMLIGFVLLGILVITSIVFRSKENKTLV